MPFKITPTFNFFSQNKGYNDFDKYRVTNLFSARIVGNRPSVGLADSILTLFGLQE